MLHERYTTVLPEHRRVTRLDWFNYYAERYGQLTDELQKRQCADLALWYFLLDYADKES